MLELENYVGEIVMVMRPTIADSAGTGASNAKLASDNDTGVSIEGMERVYFILAVGALVTGATANLQIQYASNGAASDAASSGTGWTCTDALVSFTSTGENEIYILDFDIGRKGLTEQAGKLYATWEADDGPMALVAIPIPGTKRLPSTNENTITWATSTA